MVLGTQLRENHFAYNEHLFKKTLIKANIWFLESRSKALKGP